jgi:8-oxo-dGTP pyrophosphatase MutT (NUDIX family)
MVAGSILPIAIHKGKLYFLFGKENSMEDSSKGFSDFGGGCENNEKPFETALREGGEELTGFLGDGSDVRKLINQNGGTYKITHNDYHVHIFRTEYDENLPKYYNANHNFLWERMNKKVLNDSKLFEKIEIQWFSIEDMKKRKSEFRKFYQEIVDKFLRDLEKITRFIKTRSTKSNRKTIRSNEN